MGDRIDQQGRLLLEQEEIDSFVELDKEDYQFDWYLSCLKQTHFCVDYNFKNPTKISSSPDGLDFMMVSSSSIGLIFDYNFTNDNNVTTNYKLSSVELKDLPSVPI
jgi:hypothetical protein